jgi:hypothetical protein
MHPVARVSIKYWNTSVRNKFFGARFIVYFALHIFLCVYKPPEDGHRSGPKHVVRSAQ